MSGIEWQYSLIAGRTFTEEPVGDDAVVPMGSPASPTNRIGNLKRAVQ